MPCHAQILFTFRSTRVEIDSDDFVIMGESIFNQIFIISNLWGEIFFSFPFLKTIAYHPVIKKSTHMRSKWSLSGSLSHGCERTMNTTAVNLAGIFKTYEWHSPWIFLRVPWARLAVINFRLELVSEKLKTKKKKTDRPKRSHLSFVCHTKFVVSKLSGKKFSLNTSLRRIIFSQKYD